MVAQRSQTSGVFCGYNCGSKGQLQNNNNNINIKEKG